MNHQYTEFEKYKLVYDFIYPKNSFKSWVTEDNYSNHFNTDWNELISVIEELEEIVLINDGSICINILSGVYSTAYDSNHNLFEFTETKKDKITSTYEIVVKVIDWYNTNQDKIFKQ